MTDWWTGIPAAETTIDCCGQIHTLRWERGQLTALDHDDPKAEATLAALAGETVPCLERLRAWDNYRDDARVLTLASRGLTDTLDVPTDRRPHPQAPKHYGEGDALLKLLALGGGLPDRLQAHAAAAWASRLQNRHSSVEAVLPQLTAALYGRLLLATRLWLAEPQLSIDITMVHTESERLLERSAGTVAISLPFAWLTEVWARGITTVFGRFCLGATTENGAHWTLDTIGPDLETVTQLSVTID